MGHLVIRVSDWCPASIDGRSSNINAKHGPDCLDLIGRLGQLIFYLDVGKVYQHRLLLRQRPKVQRSVTSLRHRYPCGSYILGFAAPTDFGTTNHATVGGAIECGSTWPAINVSLSYHSYWKNIAWKIVITHVYHLNSLWWLWFLSIQFKRNHFKELNANHFYAWTANYSLLFLLVEIITLVWLADDSYANGGHNFQWDSCRNLVSRTLASWPS